MQGLKGTPLGGQSVTLEGMIGDKLGTGKGAFFPLLQMDQPDQVLLVFVPNVTAADLDKRESSSIEVSGQLKPIEDAGVASAVEGKLQGKLLQKNGKPVYLEASSDPWPAAEASGSATPGQTP